MMTYFIATVNDSMYRVVTVEDGSIKDLDLETIKSLGIPNFSEDKINTYPRIGGSNPKNKIVILHKIDDTKYKVTDGTGYIRDISFDKIKSSSHEMIANICDFPELMNSEDISSKVNGSGEFGFYSAKQKILAALGKSSILPIKSDINSSGIKDSKITELDDVLTKEDELKRQKEQARETLISPLRSSVASTRIVNAPSSYNIDINKVTIDDTLSVKMPAIESKYFQNYYLDIVEEKDGRVLCKGISPVEYDGIVELPDNVTHLTDNCFRSCRASGYRLHDGLVYLGEFAFAYTHANEIKLPSTVNEISHYCFYFSRLDKVDLTGINSIGNYSFSNTRLQEVDLPETIQFIGIGTFKDCIFLEKVTHKPSIYKIRSKAFEGCTSLTEFDFTGVTELENRSFFKTGLREAILPGEINYLQTNTIQSDNIVKVELLEGMEKLGDRAVVSKSNDDTIIWTCPKSLVNVAGAAFKECDKVRCYHYSSAENTAKVIGCEIEYLDEDTISTPKAIVKSKLFGIDIASTISDTIVRAFDYEEDPDVDFELDESRLINVALSDDIIGMFGIGSAEIPDDYEEKLKFKIIIGHLSRVCKLDKVGISESTLSLHDTFSIKKKEVYSDGVSRIFELTYVDNKYNSLWSTYIVALTGNNLRYCCLCNRYTDIYCKTSYSKDLSGLLKFLKIGDTLGYNCIISNNSYKEICCAVGPRINGYKSQVNIMQALFNCAITIKLESNAIAMILPLNNKIIKFNRLGKDVYANEKEDSYKSKNYAIADMQDYDSNSIIDYSDYSQSRGYGFFEYIKGLNDSGRSGRLKEYSHIGHVEITPYTKFRNYCLKKNIESIDDIDLEGLKIIATLPIMDSKRTEAWFNKSVGSALVPAENPEIRFKDGSYVKQHKSVKRVASRNKLFATGDRTCFIFEIYNKHNKRISLIGSVYDFETIVNQLLTMLVGVVPGEVVDDAQKVYTDPDKFDLVDLKLVLKIAPAHKEENDNLWLVVYKPNGLYYLAYLTYNAALLLIQIGDINVLTDYFYCKDVGNNYKYKSIEDFAYRVSRRRTFMLGDTYKALLAARALVINGSDKYSDYEGIKIYPQLKYMFGVNKLGDKVYEIPGQKKQSIDDDEILDFGDPE